MNRKNKAKPGQRILSQQTTSLSLTRYIFYRPTFVVVMLPLILIAIGTSGYMLIEGWSMLDAVYMTIITMSTIGYGEISPLSPAGRVFTIGLIVMGVISASFAVTATIDLFSSKEFLEEIRTRRRRRTLQNIKNHCIICGFGRMGRSLADELENRGTKVIIIDNSIEAIEKCRKQGFKAVFGTASDEQILNIAGLERADSLVTATPSDAENVFIILTAKSINPNLTIISRCNSESSLLKIEKAGADTVISPYSLAGRRIAHMLTHPNVTNFLDGILDFGDHQMRLEEFIIEKDSPLAGKTLQEAKLRTVILAVDHPGETVFTHPSADTKLLPGTAIIVMGLDHELNLLEQEVKG